MATVCLRKFVEHAFVRQIADVESQRQKRVAIELLDK